MLEAKILQAREAAQAVGIYRRSTSNITPDEIVYRRAGEVLNDLHPNATRSLSALLHRCDDQCGLPPLELATATEAHLDCADPCVIHLHLAMEWFAGYVHHSSSEFVKHHPRSFITSKTELALKKEGRQASFVSRHQVCRPKPHCKRSLGVVEDCPRRERDLVTAGGTLPAPPFDQRIGVRTLASWALVAVGPPAHGQVLLASLLSGELELELAQSGRERHLTHALILPVVVY